MRGPMRWWKAACAAVLLLAAGFAWAQDGLRIQEAIDPGGQAGIEQAASGALAFSPLERPRAVQLGTGALWLRVDLPRTASDEPTFLLLPGAAFLNRVTLFTRTADGRWAAQQAGDHVPVAQWSHPNFAPLFALPAGGARTAWLRIENRPAPVSTHVRLLTATELQVQRQWTYLLVGGYLGFGVLVMLVALMMGRLAADVALHSYAAYVACMLLFQLAYTGVGAVFFWPGSATFANAAPALFMLLMTSAGIWNIRNATALQRHAPRLDRAVLAFCLFGLAFPVPYLAFDNTALLAVLNVYGLLSVVLSITLCLWTWRRGEPWSLWLFLCFLPVHLAYPFPALRAAGVLPDSWATQYAVLIGSAIEIPLLLYVLHRRARDFSENRARLRALDSTDPLTGLVLPPVLHLRLRDALRRGHRLGHRCALLLVDLANHEAIAAGEGRAAADRALVVTASRLTRLVREVDTVCRIRDTRFAVLIEGPCDEGERQRLAQHIVARGLEPLRTLPRDMTLRLRVVTVGVPDGVLELDDEGMVNEQSLLGRLDAALDARLNDQRRSIHHLHPRDTAA